MIYLDLVDFLDNWVFTLTGFDVSAVEREPHGSLLEEINIKFHLQLEGFKLKFLTVMEWAVSGF